MADQSGFKLQWSKFTKNREEQYVVRSNEKEEFEDLRNWVENQMEIKAAADSIVEEKTQEPFPNDTGPTATLPHVITGAQNPPLCGIHGTPMVLKPSGISKSGKPYPAFWSCPQRNADNSFCKYRPSK